MNLQRFTPFVALVVSGVWAQQSQCDSGFNWNKNSLGQNPCVVGSVLATSCRNPWGNYLSLNSLEHYAPDQRLSSDNNHACDCNTVMYSLYMACALCQGRDIYPWPQWEAQCGTTHTAQDPFGVSQGTAVPHWAYYNITTLPSMIFDEGVAMGIGRDPEVLLDPEPTAFTPQFVRERVHINFARDYTIHFDTSSGPDTGTIIGIVVGVFISKGITIALCHAVRRRRIQRHQVAQQTGQQPAGQQPARILPGDNKSSASKPDVPPVTGPPPSSHTTVSPPPVTVPPPAVTVPSSPMNDVPLPPYNPYDPLGASPQSPPTIMTSTMPPNSAHRTYTGTAEA